MSMGHRGWQLALCLPLLAAACSDAPTSKVSKMERFPVRGKLLVNGNPAKGAMIRFHPVENSLAAELLPAAFVQEDGSFTLGGDGKIAGAPAGEYAVTVLWKEGSGPPALLPDKLNMKYADPKKPVCTVIVEKGETVLEPINIKTDLNTAPPPPPDDQPEKKSKESATK